MLENAGIEKFFKIKTSENTYCMNAFFELNNNNYIKLFVLKLNNLMNSDLM